MTLYGDKKAENIVRDQCTIRNQHMQFSLKPTHEWKPVWTREKGWHPKLSPKGGQ